MDYVPHTQDDQKQMLKIIGVDAIEALFADIPEKFRLNGLLDLPEPLSEPEIFSKMKSISSLNAMVPTTLTGAGAYHHYIPAAVKHVISRSEFYTAYTPYQAEISQGILQAIYEYQTMIAGLTGTQVANASMYDGATAMAEAAVLSSKTLNRKKFVVGRSVHPEYRQVLATYAWANGNEVIEASYDRTGQLDQLLLRDFIDRDTAAVIVQSPNFIGIIENIGALSPGVHEQGANLIAVFTEATSLGILKPAGMLGADFVVGEGQAFGNPVNYGGPCLGIFAASEKYVRKVPGRLAGATVDKNGKRGYVLTLQTREQHIRRERATSNICTNEALCALAASVYLVSLGKNLKALGELNIRKAHYLKEKLSQLKGWKTVFPGPTYNEFVMACPNPARVNRKLQSLGIIGGYEIGHNYSDLENCLLICATEMLTRETIDKIVVAVSEVTP
ncbi:MAG: aminomethyl-transferring glycine dehydrogenase subunit GcvPA [Deltaproteobacteria bacterium]|nr:aminomethyl-transferring glycine dehydrogenase subunit GcvPA [Deltaproteobacteria bacterium]